MAIYLHELSVPERDFVAGENGPFDLPVNPVSFILLHIRGDVGAAAPDYGQLVSILDRVIVSFKGTQIVAVNGADLVRLVQHVWGRAINIENFNAISPAQVALTIPIPFGRKPFWLSEAFPATRRGEFTLSLERAATTPNLSNVRFAVEVVELLDAEPTQFLKYVTISRSISSGDPDLELPIGNPLYGVLLFSPVALGGVPISETVRRVKMLVDRVEFQIADAAFDVVRSVGMLRGADFNEYVPFSSNARNYAYLDFDPLLDDAFKIETEGRASVRLRFTSDVAGTVRAVPLEMIRLPGGAAA